MFVDLGLGCGWILTLVSILFHGGVNVDGRSGTEPAVQAPLPERPRALPELPLALPELPRAPPRLARAAISCSVCRAIAFLCWRVSWHSLCCSRFSWLGGLGFAERFWGMYP